MTIRDTAALRHFSRDALAQSPTQRTVALVYTGVLVGLSLLVTAGDYLLEQMISETGGLSNLGTRTVLSTVQSMLPILQMLLMLGWNAGYFTAVLKFSRSEQADGNTLKSGFSLFFPMLRAMLLEGLIYFALCFLSFYLSMQIYMFTPWAQDLVEVMEPILPSVLSGGTPVLEDAMVLPALQAMAPMFLIFGALYFLLSVPVSYRLRMSTFCLIDAPKAGAMKAMATSRRIMHRNCFQLFKLDLSFWWYHGLLALASGIQMLPMLDLLPMDYDAAYYLCYGIYLAIVFAVYALARNRVETAYAAAYETIREKPQEPTQVVLGNIFDM